MPYASVSELPDSVREHLPEHAREIFLEAFNNAWEQYADRDDREETAFRVAWSAVKQKYRKSGDKWVRKQA
ncbi:cation transport regulator [Thiohalobacter sp. COW1]|uniref:Cation transport regulator chaB n=1 Tax=Thiohalobacter thiocyanaticus TaxID=585455 RepID=A0A1Z4VND8_9GAMM|nr:MULTISPECIES: ChaB family protein [Thiohalobacter]BAZ93129.1 cation transport regulator chaB [Thiohalobacter thiocyanaticus]BCO31859.1 cation transport regulator [Thiohalobacter sp. COW1]